MKPLPPLRARREHSPRMAGPTADRPHTPPPPPPPKPKRVRLPDLTHIELPPLELAPLNKPAGMCTYGRCPMRVRTDHGNARFCSDTCRRLARRDVHRARGRVTRQDYSEHYDPRDLGPETPLNGVTPAEHRRRQGEKAVRAALDGLSQVALYERFGHVAEDACRRAGIGFERMKGLPYGAPT